MMNSSGYVPTLSFIIIPGFFFFTIFAHMTLYPNITPKISCVNNSQFYKHVCFSLQVRNKNDA